MYRLFDGVVACDFPLPGVPEVHRGETDINVSLGQGAASDAGYDLGELRARIQQTTFLVPGVSIRDSKVEQIRVYPPDNDDGATVGNGEMRSSGFLLGLQANVLFGRSGDDD